MEEETWLPVVGYEGRYAVSDLGRVKSIERLEPRSDGHTITRKERVLKFGVSGNKEKGQDYNAVKLYDGAGTGKNFTIHTLVINAFIGPPPSPDLVTRHKDGTRFNNRADNLEWGTESDNAIDRQRHGTDHNSRKTHCDWGHSLDEAIIRIQALSGRPRRECQLCSRVRGREGRRRQIGYYEKRGLPVPSFEEALATYKYAGKGKGDTFYGTVNI